MSALGRTQNLDSVKVRAFNYQYPDGKYPDVNKVLVVADNDGHTKWSSTLVVDSVGLNGGGGSGTLTYNSTNLLLNGVPVVGATGPTGPSNIISYSFVSPSSNTVSIPSWANRLEYRLVGGGGGGGGGIHPNIDEEGGSGGGGGGSGYEVSGILPVDTNISVSYTVGAGGTGGNYATLGSENITYASTGDIGGSSSITLTNASLGVQSTITATGGNGGKGAGVVVVYTSVSIPGQNTMSLYGGDGGSGLYGGGVGVAMDIYHIHSRSEHIIHMVEQVEQVYPKMGLMDIQA